MTTKRTAPYAILATVFLCTPLSATAANASGPGGLNGILSPSRDVTIEATIDGTVADIFQLEGARVKEAKEILQLVDAEQAARVAVARVSATSNAKHLLAETQYSQAKRKYADILAAHKNGAATPWEVQDARAERDRTKFDVQNAQEAQSLEAKRLELEEAILARYHIKAPFDGEIVEIFVAPGETVSRGDQLVRTIDTSHLEFEAFAPADQYPALIEGRTYKGRTDAPFDKSFTATLSHIDPVFEAATGAVRVVFEIENDGTLPAGAPSTIFLSTPKLMPLNVSADAKSEQSTNAPSNSDLQGGE
ncbi:MAG: efflux RND transporter periplasmic adaptor subunit [Pseudomonadota bacterium]